MLFNSLEFFAFLAPVYLLYRLLPFRGQNWMLLLAGYIFYGWWDVRFLFLIAFSTTVDFTIGLLMEQPVLTRKQRLTISLFPIASAFLFLCPDWTALQNGRGTMLADLFTFQPMGIQVLIGTIVAVAIANLAIARLPHIEEERRRWILIVASVIVNLTFLGFFKYFNFFVDSLQAAIGGLGFDAANLRLHVILPVGISFYTFQSLSYTIDVYRRRARPTTYFWDFALFVAYFPPMVAGPIERARHLLAELTTPRKVRLSQTTHGVVLILIGLFKKIAIADGLAPAVGAIFGSTGAVSQSDVAIATMLFAVQILCDFSGYSDVARGVSKLLGIELMVNFNLPYFSRNPSEFWRRWHISLSSWLRDYLYISLGGNRRGEVRTYINLFLTMLLGGLWHGAAWTFILWGAYQGLLLVVHRAFTHGRETLPSSTEAIEGTTDRHGGAIQRAKWLPIWLSTPLRIGFFMIFVCYGWMIFRANSFEQVALFTAKLLGLAPHVAHSALPNIPLSALAGMVVLAAMQFFDYRAGRLESFLRWRASLQGGLYAALLFILAMGLSNAPVQFIYFQF
jgi:D-alanyl-lipoteichoic acid acyltransferase DltB (MBOAT superfamily)